MENYTHHTDQKGGIFKFESGGKTMAELSYVMAGANQMIIDHSFVDESLKGKGIGKNLVANLVQFVRENRIKVIPLCPFATATFQKTKEWQDVLV